MKTPAVNHPKPPKDWFVSVTCSDYSGAYYAMVFDPSGKYRTNTNGFDTHQEAKRAGIQEAHKLANQ